jgi:hypothetical protein
MRVSVPDGVPLSGCRIETRQGRDESAARHHLFWFHNQQLTEICCHSRAECANNGGVGTAGLETGFRPNPASKKVGGSIDEDSSALRPYRGQAH